MGTQQGAACLGSFARGRGSGEVAGSRGPAATARSPAPDADPGCSTRATGLATTGTPDSQKPPVKDDGCAPACVPCGSEASVVSNGRKTTVLGVL